MERRDPARGGMGGGLSRRELLAAGTGAGLGLLLPGAGAARGQSAPVVSRVEFAGLGAGPGWGEGWRCPGVANLRREGGHGLLEAGSDVFPNDPRPVAFLADCRLLDAAIAADVVAGGAGAGVVLRRTSPRDYYAAVHDAETLQLRIVRRTGDELLTLADAPAPPAGGPVVLELSAAEAGPTVLAASLRGPGGTLARVTARDEAAKLQRPGDPGVLATARTLFPSGDAVVPALGNAHLLPWAVQEGQAVMATPAGVAVVGEIARQSTARFAAIEVRSGERPRKTAPSVVAATTGLPLTRGARVHVALDLPAEVSIEVSDSPAMTRPRTIRLGRTRAFEAATGEIGGRRPGRRIYWRAVARREGTETRGPVRSFPVAGRRDSVTVAVGSCGTRFGPIFDRLTERRSHVFVWQGDLNYADTHGPLAQTMSGYAGIWRDFLANPRLRPLLERTALVAVRDDHDYGIQDANSTNLKDFALAPWDALMGDDAGYRFAAGPAEIWVLDQRRFKTDPLAPDDERKTLLGQEQRDWLLRTLAESKAPFKVICSPCTVFFPANPRDGQWATSYSAERRLLLDHIAKRVSGRTVFVSGDTHLTAVHEAEDGFEARAAPIDIPLPNDITLTDPTLAQRLRAQPDVPYADERSHFALLEVSARGETAVLDLALVREDGATPFRRRFEQPFPPDDVALRVGLDRAGARRVRRRGFLRGRVSLDRAGRVELRALLRRGRRGRLRLGRRAVRFRRAGRRRFRLALGRRGRAALGRFGRRRVVVEARYRDPDAGVRLRRIVRRLRR